ncbi:hypothetical protein [Citrobacter freundii]|uniref:hypothetical protein n=1 Tax=Citrobacter freundii TaxID=546 RepID=UPI00300D00D1
MHQSIICAFVGALLINIVNVAQAAPTTRLPPAPSPSEFTHSAKVKTHAVPPDKKTLKQKAGLTVKKKSKKENHSKCRKESIRCF